MQRQLLDNDHKQITICIDGLKKKSEDLSAQIKNLTVGAGGVVGCLGSGAAIYTGAIALGAGLAVNSLIGGYAVADYRERQLEETRKKLRECERELNDCGDVVERCKRVLRKSEEELNILKRIVRELERNFRRL